MARIDTLPNFLTDVADAIRTKTGSSGTIAAEDFDTEIENLPSGADISEYFHTEITQDTSTYGYANIIKKFPTITVANNVTSLAYCFGGIQAVDSLPKVICGNNVTNMAYMYANTSSGSGNNKVTQLDVSGLDTSNVTSMYSMFYGLSRLTSLIGLNNFDTSNVTNMSNMFCMLNNLSELDISSFNTSKVTNMSGMFSNLNRNCNIVFPNNFDTTNVTGTGITSMFHACPSITELPPITITNKITSMYDLFFGCGFQTVVFPSTWDTSNVTNTSQIFLSCSATSIDMSKCDFSNVTNTSSMFGGCGNLTFIDMRTFDTSKITNSNNMFYNRYGEQVPDNCEIIVGNDSDKTWFSNNFSRLTNVKTVAEYEAEQNQ